MMKWNKKTKQALAWILLFTMFMTDARLTELFSAGRPFAVWADTGTGAGDTADETGQAADESAAAGLGSGDFDGSDAGLINRDAAAEGLDRVDATWSDAAEEMDTDLAESEADLEEISLEYVLTDLFTVVLQWNLLEMHEGTYEVYVNGEAVADVDGDMYETERLEPGEIYEYRVRSLDPDGNVTGRSELITLAAPDVLAISGRVTLTESRNAYALSVARNATLDLNGYSVRTFADSEISGTLMLNEGALYQQGNLTFGEDSELQMTKPNDFLEVQGDLTIFAGTSWKKLTAGRMDLYGEFWQETEEGFVAAGNHRVSLKGEQEQTVTLAAGSQFAILELENSSEEGVCFTHTLVAEELIDNGCPIRMGQENHYFGRKLEEDVQIEGDYVLMGGELDLNGHTMTVGGNFIHTSGKVIPNTGTLTVSGDYMMGRPEESEEAGGAEEGTEGSNEDEETVTCLQGTGILLMEKEEDLIEVGGSFHYASKADHRTNLIAGELRIGGNLLIGDHQNNGIFYTAEKHRLILNGSGDQQVDLVQIAGLVLEKEEGTVIFKNRVTVTTYLDPKEIEINGHLLLNAAAEVVGPVIHAETVSFGGGRILQEELSFTGDLILTGSNRIEAPVRIGGNLTISGNVTQKADMKVGGDTILIGSNYSSCYEVTSCQVLIQEITLLFFCSTVRDTWIEP